MKDNASVCLTQFIGLLKVPVTGASVSEELAKHPDHPSLLALSDVLNHWRVPNGAYRLKFGELPAVPIPFIAHLSNNGGGFVVVKSLGEEFVTVSSERWQNHRLTVEEFRKAYTGTVLAAEPAQGAGERNYRREKRKEMAEGLRLPFVTAGIALLAVALLARSPIFGQLDGQTALLAFAKSAGLVTSVLLLVQSIDTNNPLIRRLCGGGKKSNCNAILSSKAAKLTEEVSWSEIGFFYFASTWLAFLSGPSTPSFFLALAVLNLLSLPYTFYSVYYQYRVARQWCVLCCLVQAILWVEFASFLPSLSLPLEASNLGDWGLLLLCVLIPLIAWVFLKPFLLKAQQLAPLRKQLKAFKYNASTFSRALSEQPRYAPPHENHSIVLGNKEAKQVITMVSNPFCSPCSAAHQTLEEWLSSRNDLQLRVVFATSGDSQDHKTKVARHLMSLNRQNRELVGQALHSWYAQGQKDYEAWAALHPVGEETAEDLSLKRQREWCSMVGIQFTPTILVNGSLLPQNYSLEDIKYFF